MHVDILGLIVVGMAMFAGAVVHGTVGFGAVIVAFPVLVLVEPALLPQSVILASLPLTVVVYLRNRDSVIWPEVVNLAVSRIPGVAVGVLMVRSLSPNTLAYFGACFVLLAVVVTAVVPPVPRTAPLLSLAGLASGFFSTSVGVGGPPLGLMYQHETGGDLRATVGTVGLTGVATTTVGLAIGGQLSATDIRTGMALVPFGLAGALSARYVLKWADQRARRIVQIVSVLGAILAIVRLSM